MTNKKDSIKKNLISAIAAIASAATHFIMHTQFFSFFSKYSTIDLDVIMIKNTVKIIYDSIAQAARENNLAPTNIVQCCKNKRKTCGGYKWQYKKVEQKIKKRK